MKPEGLPGRVLRTSLWVAGFVALFLLALGRHGEMLSWALGTALGLGVFGTTVFTGLRLWTSPDDIAGPLPWVRGPAWFVLLLTAKWLAAAALVWYVVRWPGARIGWFVAGAGVVQAVFLLKALGQALADASARKPDA